MKNVDAGRKESLGRSIIPRDLSMRMLTAVLVCGALLLGSVRARDFEGRSMLLASLEPEERMYYFGIQYLLNQYQQRQYLTLPTRREREEWLERFWLDRDPTPATEENERKVEHEKRASLARKHYGTNKEPGWDKRGETLIRWGVPSTRTRIFADIGFYRMSPPGEVWYYESLDMLIHFQDFNLKGEFIYAIEPYGRSAREEQDRYATLNELMKSGTFQTLYAFEYLDLDEMEDIVDFNPDDIDYIADVDVRMAMPRDLIAEWEQEKIEESLNNFYKYLEENPTIYSFELDSELLSLYFDVTSFRRGPDSLRTEVNIEIPTEEIRFVRQGDTLRADVELRVLARDYEMNEVALGTDSIRITYTGEGEFDGPSLVPGQVVLGLEPGYYRIGVEAVDKNSGIRGVMKTNLELPSLGGGLAVSDIQFASRIDEASAGARFVKDGLRIVPHPMHAYRIPFPLTFYFEIYGLSADREGFCFYSVDYRITPLEKRRRGPVLEEAAPVVSSKFETTGSGPTQAQQLRIATENLWQGPFELTVTVTDRRTMARVEKRSRFSILD
jgi:GWxTD domain-containing protein